MTRILAVAVAIALVLLLGGIVATIAAPASPLAVPLLAAAAIVFVGLVFAIFGSAWRTKGWSIRHLGGGPR